MISYTTAMLLLTSIGTAGVIGTLIVILRQLRERHKSEETTHVSTQDK